MEIAAVVSNFMVWCPAIAEICVHIKHHPLAFVNFCTACSKGSVTYTCVHA